VAILALNRSTKRFADLGGIIREWTEDYGVEGFAIRYKPADGYSGESYYAVGCGETLGEVEMCSVCGEAWLGIAGSIHDEEHCIFCGARR
jgi:hypothetical protein